MICSEHQQTNRFSKSHRHAACVHFTADMTRTPSPGLAGASVPRNVEPDSSGMTVGRAGSGAEWEAMVAPFKQWTKAPLPVTQSHKGKVSLELQRLGLFVREQAAALLLLDQLVVVWHKVIPTDFFYQYCYLLEPLLCCTNQPDAVAAAIARQVLQHEAQGQDASAQQPMRQQRTQPIIMDLTEGVEAQDVEAVEDPATPTDAGAPLSPFNRPRQQQQAPTDDSMGSICERVKKLWSRLATTEQEKDALRRALDAAEAVAARPPAVQQQSVGAAERQKEALRQANASLKQEAAACKQELGRAKAAAAEQAGRAAAAEQAEGAQRLANTKLECDAAAARQEAAAAWREAEVSRAAAAPPAPAVVDKTLDTLARLHHILDYPLTLPGPQHMYNLQSCWELLHYAARLPPGVSLSRHDARQALLALHQDKAPQNLGGRAAWGAHGEQRCRTLMTEAFQKVNTAKEVLESSGWLQG